MLVGASASSAQAQSYTLNDLAGRAASAATVPGGAASGGTVRANDLGLRLQGNAAYYPDFATAGDGAARGGLRASADLVWELFEGGLGEARYNAARANARTAPGNASLNTPAMTAAQAQFRARGLALTLLQAEARAQGAAAAAGMADSAAARYRRLYATRDVLRSTALRADVEARRLQADAERYGTAVRLLRGELSRQLQLPASFRIAPPDGLPSPDEASLERGVRVNVSRALSVSPDAFPERYAFEDFRFAVYVGYAYRELYNFNGSTGGGAGSGPRAGLRLSVPLRFGGSTASVTAAPVEREARLDAATQSAMTRLADLLDEFYRAASRYSQRQAQAEIERVRLEESRLLASGGMGGARNTPNEVILAEANAREALGDAEAARLEAWRIYYELLALSGT